MAKKKRNVVCEAQSGSQELFLECPHFECFYEGTRGSGKTYMLLMDFAQDIGKGYGSKWRGIIFRRTFPQLADLRSKSKEIFFRIFPRAKFSNSDHKWTFPEGEELYFRYFDRPDDYWNYHGHEYGYLGFDELCSWSGANEYDSLKSVCRSPHPDIFCRIRATGNPLGVGHGWVKQRFIDPCRAGVPIEDRETGLTRVRIHGTLFENKILLENDPSYVDRLKLIDDPIKRKAWLDGSWDIVAGGAIDDVWDERIHVIRPFDVPGQLRIDRSFDWGSSKPFSVGWWCESDGSEILMRDGTAKSWPPKTLFRIAEFYGTSGRPNEGNRMIPGEIARKIIEIESGFPFLVSPGPADSSIWNSDRGSSIADEMERYGVRWLRADKKAGSLVAGLEALRSRLSASLKSPMEEPGLFIFDSCSHWLRTVPTIPRDSKDPDKIDSNAEDHCADETRYKLLHRDKTITVIQNVADF